ncbi:MAG: hypothetical protein IPO92_06625 [Saprospiraceae bacterium]|nr:hypothetical protein [Saprospiraceae bacterium]
MRLLLLIIFFFFSCLSFGQDSLQLDTTFKTIISTVRDTMLSDSTSSESNDIVVKKKKQKKRKKIIIKEGPVIINEKNVKNNDAIENIFGPVIIGILIIVIIVFSVFFRSIFSKSDRHNTSSSKDEGFLTDYISRILLPRREYYRNVYLKSEDWKRKRYVVLRRDNWRCVYCGGRATQVHHTRYAKLNIGKEPIEWLVSVCITCHDSIHQQ